ncbi:golgin subfamily A member 3-like isoform X2 [Corythoichthys intestinalis]|uniref:golgin subfamily A member 3-like isoform X2 n=1 Tax=Corythoichthys intestinalis TaxID=161448 RepID=UPI0025A52E48|nr:golgin subfamily A member 3-like isoform X2 [Corythoichthys intestinalis]
MPVRMVVMKFSAAAAVLLLLIGSFQVFGLLQTSDRGWDRSFRMRTVMQDSSVPPELPVIWTELVGLRQLVLSLQAAVVDQRQFMRNSESRLRDGQEEAEKQRLQLDAIKVQMDMDRKLVFSLQAGAVDQRQSLRTTESQLKDGQEVAGKQRQQLEAIQAQMDADRKLVLNLQAASVDQHQVLRIIENRLTNGEEAAEKNRQVLDLIQVQMEADKKMVSNISADLRKREELRQEEALKLHFRLNTSENSLEDFKRKTSALASDLPFLRMRLRASESILDQLRRKSSGDLQHFKVLASRLCLVEDLQKRSSVEGSEFQGNQNSSGSDMEKNGHQQESRLETDLSHLRQNMSTLHARLLHLESKVTTGDRHLQDIRAAVVNTQNDTQIQSEGLKMRLSVVENLVEDLQTDKSVKSTQLSRMEEQLVQGHNNTAALEGSVATTAAQLEELNALSSAQATQLDNMEARLMQKAAVLEVRLNVSEKLLEELKIESRGQMTKLHNMELQLTHNTAALDVRLNVSEELLEELKTECTGQLLAVTESLKLADQVKDLWSKNTALEVKLNTTANFLEEFKTESTERLAVSEKLLEELKTYFSAQTRQLSSIELRLMHNIHNNEVMQGKFNISEQMMDDLKATTEEFTFRLRVLEQRSAQASGETKVAFAAALTNSGSVGPFDQETTLIFSKVFTNVGRAYDETSGVFTAPVGGVYVFSFTAADFLKGYMGVTLYRNQEPIISSLDLNDHGGYASATNGALIRLAAGDRVRLSLPASYRLYDDTRSFSVFSGFLLFPLEADQ